MAGDNHKLKIAYVLYHFPVISETFVLDEILAMRGKGIDIPIFSFKKSPDTIKHKEAEGLVGGVRYLPDPKTGVKSFIQILIPNLKFLIISPLEYIRCLFKYAFRIGKKEFLQVFYLCDLISKERPHCLHAHFAGQAAVASMIVSRFLRISFCVTAHAHDMFVAGPFLQEILQKAEYVIVKSNFNKKYLLGKYPGIPQDKIEVIPCGINPEIFKPSPPAEGDIINILSVGRLVEKKGFKYLVKACRRMLDKGVRFRCEIVGDGPLKPDLLDEIRKSGLEGVVQLKGAVSRDRLLGLLAESNIFVLPSIVAEDGDTEATPLALTEALASERAVVSTNVAGIPELIVSGENGILVQQEDDLGLAEAIERLIEDPGLRDRLGERGRATVKEKFDLFKNTERLAGLFREYGSKKKRFKILFVSATSHIGGAEVSLINLLRRLNRKFYSALVAVPGDGLLADRLRELDVDIRFLRTMEFSRRRILQFLAGAFKLASLARKEAVDLIHSNSIYTAEQSFIAARIAGIKCISHVRDLVPILGANSVRLGAFRKMTRLIAISDAVKRDLVEKLGVPEQQITRIYNGVDVKEFNPTISGESFRQEFKFGSEKLVGMIARLSPEKEQELFLHTAAEVSQNFGDIRFIIIGDGSLGSETFQRELEDMPPRLNLHDKVVFTGFRQDIPNVMAALDVLVVPSRAEPFGRVIVEAMAMEKPVIASRSGAVPEIIPDAYGQLIPRGDVRGFASAIKSLLRDEERCRRLGRMGREIAVGNFSIERHTSAIEKLYKEILR